MPIVKVFPVPARFISLAVLLIFLQPGHNVSETSRLAPPAHTQRGDQVERRYNVYSGRLVRYYESLSTALRQRAPDLLAHLQALDPIDLGYQILPRIVADAPAEAPARANAVAYSWPWTEQLIDRAMREIDHAEAELHRARTMNSIQSRAVLERLARDYQRQSQWHGNIDAHVRYNRLWQAAIAADRAGYDRETALYIKVLERQNILERLNRAHAPSEKSPAFQRSHAAVGFSAMTRSLKTREALLTRRIDQALDEMRSPVFIKMEHSNADWIFHVPLFTDIDDQEFVTEVKLIIETIWRLDDRGNTYRVALDVSYIPTDLLYANSSSKPNRGEQINIRRHLERFPAGGAILTTGGLTTHVQDYAIVLGPHPVTPRVLAHEFGHILGFRDRYIRGYKSLGRNGFQITEVVADPQDIMAATARGVVLPNHFSSLVERATIARQPNAPVPKAIHVNRIHSRT